ncbi:MULTISPECIES: dihydroxyacetone kinase subunit DhaL [Caldanaerobacter]|jgi:dihydroxyacetone kinase-like protein|uniref:phosphoenolpyruvate--glycerone phosphotransferase n=4 Tax=Caldanaerobacter subterraneus TaxID=911092 RepID=Q8R8K0_CALS4|nr:MULTISPECIES: dihydroxyacetone kinase subunit DhaL [Caldanaerobacter]AAM25174.1 Dihydroxyacetone kinase [Caldanaerobacter subterraneus subsp. tengcongensis MB4]ERM92044.1 dihydroxyacetone kinase subunit DhaL [Caldanaerobacter subterraneus subsp. yonseiensis KB-1]KKC29005.1 dihydroxyacetone kinase [Caldanaerobacter subterraneus subsp. pacificus DSM 12653]MCS3915230.1 dihydroxyacetone kinase-like protein [Caldanaerobacter subterraneus subsp. tengcongensis MB4]MDI3518397.1 phosphoenolpyruvate-
MVITKEDVLKVIDKIVEVIRENKEYLTELDSAIGDADHGINMDRGFEAVKQKLATIPENSDIGTILKTVGMTLVSTVGGASGPLYGTAFMRAGQAVQGKTELTEEDVVKIFEAALQGIKDRGKAQAGDKTMIDSIEPAYKALKESLENNIALPEALKRAVNAAKEGMEYTKNISARKGRASYLGERSIGHIDPGATSSYLMIKALADVINLL